MAWIHGERHCSTNEFHHLYPSVQSTLQKRAARSYHSCHIFSTAQVPRQLWDRNRWLCPRLSGHHWQEQLKATAKAITKSSSKNSSGMFRSRFWFGNKGVVAVTLAVVARLSNGMLDYNSAVVGRIDLDGNSGPFLLRSLDRQAVLHGFQHVSKCLKAKPDLFHAIHVSTEAAAHLRAMWQAASAWHSKKCLGRIWADHLDDGWYKTTSKCEFCVCAVFVQV